MADRAHLQSVPQTGFDETPIEDKEVEAALEERERLKAIASGHNATYRNADEAARGLLQRLELPEGGIARVGRFRLERKITPGRAVSFETKARDRIQINLAKE